MMEHLLTLILILHISSQGTNSLMALFSMRNFFFGLIAYLTENTDNPYHNCGNSSVASLVTIKTRAPHNNTECIIKVRLGTGLCICSLFAFMKNLCIY